MGDVGYWPPAQALRLFFDPTPASPVKLVGRIEGYPTLLRGESTDEPLRGRARRVTRPGLPSEPAVGQELSPGPIFRDVTLGGPC